MYSAKLDDRAMYPFGKAIIPGDIKNIGMEHPKDIIREATINKINSRWVLERIPEDDERRKNKDKKAKEEEIDLKLQKIEILKKLKADFELQEKSIPVPFYFKPA